MEQSQMLSERLLLLQLLKVSSHIKWRLEGQDTEMFNRFMKILVEITQDPLNVEDKTRAYWEKALIDSWERIIDKSESRNHDFFVVRDNFIRDADKKESMGDIKAEQSESGKKSSQGPIEKESSDGYSDSDFV